MYTAPERSSELALLRPDPRDARSLVAVRGSDEPRDEASELGRLVVAQHEADQVRHVVAGDAAADPRVMRLRVCVRVRNDRREIERTCVDEHEWIPVHLGERASLDDDVLRDDVDGPDHAHMESNGG